MTSNPCLFLSHSGRDNAAAITLRDRLLHSPAAVQAGLKVWLDTSDLQAGQPWKTQIENVIAYQATSFAVMVGAGGVQNWVAAETDAALSRAVSDDDFRFIPVLFSATAGELSPFARRYHGVRDPLENPDQLQALLAAALGQDGKEGRPALTDEPFRGLHSMEENWADRFFGREAETAAVIAQLRANPLVAIVADSGTGKSSLAMAGVAAAWRGGAFTQDSLEKPEPLHWNVVTMRPLNDPLFELRTAITDNAVEKGLGVADQQALSHGINPNNPDATFTALYGGGSPRDTRTLLVIDQAEEFFTQTDDQKELSQFSRLLGALAKRGQDTGRLRILVTIRADYANLLC